MSAEDNKRLVRRFFDDVLNGGNPASAPQIVAGDFVAHHPTFGDIRGLAGLVAMGAMLRTAFPDLRYAVDDVVADGDKIAVRWTATGTHDGTLDLRIMVVSPTHKKITVTGTDVFRVAGSQLAESWVSSDFFGLMIQLGVLPPK